MNMILVRIIHERWYYQVPVRVLTDCVVAGSLVIYTSITRYTIAGLGILIAEACTYAQENPYREFYLPGQDHYHKSY